MFRSVDPAAPRPGWMRPLYVGLATLLGVVLSYGLHAVIELWWLWYAPRHQLAITWTYHFGRGLCALPPLVQYGLLAAGAIGGFLIGRIWWRWIYIEGRWRSHPAPPAKQPDVRS